VKKQVLYFFVGLFLSLSVAAQTKVKTGLDYVNSFIGTARWGAAGLIPCVNVPFAMTNFTAQTRENLVSRMPYEYEDKTIMGFIATHQPNLWMGDYGYVSLMPQVGRLKVQPKDRHVAYDKAEEKATPYYYSVVAGNSNKSKIKTEIAGGNKAGIFKVTFPQSDSARFVIQTININEEPDPDWNPVLNYQKWRSDSLVAYVRIDKKKNEITGYNPDRFSVKIGPELPNFKGYFVISFDKAFAGFGCWNADSVFNGVADLHGKKRLGAFVNFKTKNGEVIKVKVGTSFISLEQARKNLDTEIPAWDFEKLVASTKKIWQEALKSFEVEGGTEDQKTIFYTALYHSMLQPRSMTEDGKYYSGFDDKIHKGIAYNDYSLWDTYRALHPLLIIAQPKRVSGMITSLLNMYEHGGWLPMWPNPAETNVMIGTHADAVIGDAFVKGIRDFNVKLAYEAMRKNSFVPPAGDTVRSYGDRHPWTANEAQAGLTYYKTVGYVPVDKTAESVSRTIEYGISNYVLAQVAKSLGEKKDYDTLMKMSRNYKNVYNKETGFMAPRLLNGQWHKDRNAGFTEGGPWTYRFGAMHDVAGMIELMGGKEEFVKQLDRNFAENHYRHDNEPGHHYVYLYNYAGQPWKTQKLLSEQLKANYKNQPNGMNGNDDCGQMSAWAVFGMLGFYPVTPASGLYAIGSPQLPKVTINTLYKGRPQRLQIIANNVSEKNIYIQKATLDGKNIDKPFLSHEQLMTGKKLVFEMGDQPNYNWK
jgi:predicted alpha-1,2-mannosidase